MKTTKLFLAALAAMVMFSCAKGDEVTTGDQQDVVVKIQTTSLSKSIKDQVTQGYKTPVNNAKVFFLNSVGQIVAGGGDITAADITAGSKKFTGVNSSAKTVYVVGNTKDASNVSLYNFATLTVGKVKADIEALVANISSQMDLTAKGVDNVVLSGEGTILKDAGTGVYSSQVSVTPTVCRFEVTSITGDDTAGVQGFDLDAIFMTGYYPSFTVNALSSGTMFANTQDNAELANVIASMKHTGTPMTGANTYSAGSTKAWSFMMPVAATTPRIVFRLNNVKFNGNTLAPDPKFVTVKSFIDATTKTPITLERGKVYLVNDVKFSKVDDIPNDNDIDVVVSVTVMGWVVVSVDPVI